MAGCSVDDCVRPYYGKGLCALHYQRWLRKGSTDLDRRPTTQERYEGLVDRSGGPDACHPWTGHLDKGYGRFWDGTYTARGNSRMVKAHRWGYLNLVEQLPRSVVVRHLCHNKACQNPKHWASGSPKDNYDDNVRSGITHPTQKLSDEEVAEIRSKYASGRFLQKSLATEYGVTPWTIHRLVTGKDRPA